MSEEWLDKRTIYALNRKEAECLLARDKNSAATSVRSRPDEHNNAAHEHRFFFKTAQ